MKHARALRLNELGLDLVLLLSPAARAFYSFARDFYQTG